MSDSCRLLHCQIWGQELLQFLGLPLDHQGILVKYLLHRILNITSSLFDSILTDLASFLLAVSRKTLISSVFQGMVMRCRDLTAGTSNYPPILCAQPKRHLTASRL